MVETHYVRVLRRTLHRRKKAVGTYYATDTASAKGDGRDVLRMGVTEDTALAKGDGRDTRRNGFTENSALAKRDGRGALHRGMAEDTA